MLMFTTFSFAQKINFDYDTAGNQILRHLCLTCRIANQEVKKYSELVESDLQKFHPEDEFSYYPNPVDGELYIEWKNNETYYISNIQLYSSTGQLLKDEIVEKDVLKKIISFENFSTGIYHVKLGYSNGNQKSIKIVKK